MGTGEWIALGSFLVVTFVAILAGLLYIIHAEQNKQTVRQLETHAKADAVMAELIPNHGSSMRDAVDRIEKAVIELCGADALWSSRIDENTSAIRRYGEFVSNLNSDFRKHLQDHINKE